MLIQDKNYGSVSSQRTMTKQGFLVVPAKLSRVGVFDYFDSELFKDGVGEIKKVARTERSLFTDETIQSFEGAPLTLQHAKDDVTAENWKKYAVGFVQNVRRDGDFLVADARVTDAEAIKAINDLGISELSCGYDADVVSGSAADYEFTPMIGNHVALVARGRCGSSCALADEDKTAMSKFKAAFKSLLETLGVKATDEQLAAIDAKEAEEAKEKQAEAQDDAKDVETKQEQSEDEKAQDDAKEQAETATKDADKVKEKLEALEVENAELKKKLAAIESKEKRDAAIADVKAVNAGFKVNDADTVRTIQERFIVESGVTDAEAVKTLSDAELAGMFTGAKKVAQKLADKQLGAALMGAVHDEQPAVMDLNKLYGAK